jgi:general secretion pathway protein H
MSPACSARSGFVTKRSGFTLIEVMVVMVIIGIIISIGVLSFGIVGNDRELQRQAMRMTTLIEMASDEAQMQGREYGLELLHNGYRFVEYDPFVVQWGEVIGDDMLRARQLGEEMEFELYLEDRRVILDDTAGEIEPAEDVRDRDPDEDYAPHVLIMSSGDITPFDIRILRNIDRASVLITLSPNGEFDIQINDESAF